MAPPSPLEGPQTAGGPVPGVRGRLKRLWARQEVRVAAALVPAAIAFGVFFAVHGIRAGYYTAPPGNPITTRTRTLTPGGDDPSASTGTTTGAAPTQATAANPPGPSPPSGKRSIPTPTSGPAASPASTSSLRPGSSTTAPSSSAAGSGAAPTSTTTTTLPAGTTLTPSPSDPPETT
jgi:hypothetical protein